jgi:chromosome segregation protein
MRLKSIELAGFKSFAKKTQLEFASAVTSIVGPNGSGKSNVAESFRFVLGEQSMKSMRGRRGEDMIWNGSATVPRAGRASVKLIFDNSDRALKLDFDEVAIERVVNRDGSNDYLLNGSSVRLRDIAELLSQANIGASGHHIISQGEADRVLSSSARERREMIEDGLGLTAFLYKKVEAKRKLQKTAENMREVEALRRELAPHLRFLGGQVKKIEESQKLRDDLADKYLEYLKRESVYLRTQEALVGEDLAAPQREHNELGQKIADLRGELSKKQDDAGTAELVSLEAEARTVASRRDNIVRDIGRIEGEIAAHERITVVTKSSIPTEQVRTFTQHIEQGLNEALMLEGVLIKEKLSTLVLVVKDFFGQLVQATVQAAHSPEELQAKKQGLEGELSALQGEEARIVAATAALRKKIESEKDANREGERELFAAMARRSELQTTLAALQSAKDTLLREREQFKAEFAEAGALLGRAAVGYEEVELKNPRGEAVSDAEVVDEPRQAQEDRRRKVERMKIKLEEIGAGNAAEVLREHQETAERDQFLMRELEDLEASAASLHQLIDELTQTLEVRFTEGIEKINTEFDAFFKLMFGGGTAELTSVQEVVPAARAVNDDEDAGAEDVGSEQKERAEEGIEIAISLPHKRIKGLHMLSGGERALTSIALIFAISQVNPPPFLILDETDAALDEANSRRYGDMISSLASRSQLILITHNRETMSRAGILYGITMGSDGVSKLLSVKFEEAVAVAK